MCNFALVKKYIYILISGIVLFSYLYKWNAYEKNDNKAFVMNVSISWKGLVRGFRFRQNDTQLYPCITISSRENNLMGFLFYVTRSFFPGL